MKRKATVSKATIQRLPVYLSYLKAIKVKPEYISSAYIAQALKLGEVQVRKDLASVCDVGKPKLGYVTEKLIAVLEAYLGYNENVSAVLVGVGRLGQALMAYKGFEKYGLKIIAGFDVSSSVVGSFVSDKPVYNVSKLSSFIKETGVYIGIITLPEEHAQETADILVSSGIRGIWNFSPTHIIVPDNVAIKNENMASSLAVLSNQLKNLGDN